MCVRVYSYSLLRRRRLAFQGQIFETIENEVLLKHQTRLNKLTIKVDYERKQRSPKNSNCVPLILFTHSMTLSRCLSMLMVNSYRFDEEKKNVDLRAFFTVGQQAFVRSFRRKQPLD